MKIDAIILAGGKGTRLRSVVSDLPKPMAPINGKPFLDILLSQLNNAGCIKNVILAVGYKAEAIINRYRNCSDYNFNIVFSVEKELLGTGGAIKKALAAVETENVLVLNGDSYVAVNIRALIMDHIDNNSSITLVLNEVEHADRYGIVSVGRDRRILSFEEKQTGRSGLINTGIYLFKRSLFDDIDGNRFISFEREILPKLVNDNSRGFITDGIFIDIGLPESYRIADEYLKEIC